MSEIVATVTTGKDGELVEQVPALEFRDISAGYEEGPVIRNVSLTIRPGETTALLGPNGAGKSTLLKTGSGLLSPTAGTVLIDGVAVNGLRPERRVGLGLGHILEERAIYRSLTVRENLTMQAPANDVEAAIARATEAFPVLGDRLRQVAGTLSGGEQQMLALAAAYSREPRVLMVDEPSLGLAPIIVDLVFEFLDTLRRRGVSLLLVDQFALRVLSLATDAYVLRQGQIVYAGSAADLLEGGVFEHYLGSEMDTL